jgi:pimeloyl-ACP methyl ester carboxylesterase
MQCPLRGLSIHYTRVGSGRPFLVFHGSPGDSARAKLEVEPAFRRVHGWSRIYPDLPGHAQTPGSDRIRNIDDYLQVLIEFADDLVPDGPIALGGISFGAYLALGFARKRPRRLGGLLLSVPEVSFSAEEDRADQRHRGPPLRTEADERPNWTDYSEDTPWLQGLPWRDLSFDLYRDRPAFPAPTLFLLGRQDADFRWQRYATLLRGFPRATFAVLDGAGHTVWRDQPQLVRSLVQEWLGRVMAHDLGAGRAGSTGRGHRSRRPATRAGDPKQKS